MKVYIANMFSYSDEYGPVAEPCIAGIFSTYEKAEYGSEDWKRLNRNFHFYSEIEEVEIDKVIQD